MRKVEKGMVYRHFKGNYYYVEDIGYNANNNAKADTKVVIYRALSTNTLYIKDLDEFSSEVDHKKYPDVQQRYRFERVNMNKVFKKILDNKE